MSQATKRKHVFQELEDPDFQIEAGQEIALVVASKGNNLHTVMSEDGETFLASMPKKFRRNVWIKRGDYVVLERIEEGVKVKAEITRILYKSHVDQLRKEGAWPAAFDEKQEKNDEVANSDEDSDLFVNTNRRQPVVEESSSEEESHEDSEEEPESK